MQTGCGRDYGKNNNPMESRFTKVYFKDGKPVGEWKRYHEGGQVKAIINYHPESDSAFTQLFDEGGKKVAEGCYLNEKKAGTWKYFFDNKLIADEQFNNGLKYGVSHKYYDTGEKLEEVDWKNGVEEGNYRIFFKTGKPFMEYKVDNNQRNGLCLTYFQNGRTELEAHYKNNLRDGDWNYYKDNGELWYTLKYAFRGSFKSCGKRQYRQFTASKL